MQIRTSSELGALARDRRREIGWSQTELARRIGTSRSWVSEMENGKERVEVALVLAALQALGLSLDVRALDVRAETRTDAGSVASSSPPRARAAGERVSTRPPLTRGGKSLADARLRFSRGGKLGS